MKHFVGKNAGKKTGLIPFFGWSIVEGYPPGSLTSSSSGESDAINYFLTRSGMNVKVFG